MTLSIQITKFKFRQYQLRTISSNLMLVKLTCHTVVYKHVHVCESINYECRKILQFTINRYLQLKTILR